MSGRGTGLPDRRRVHNHHIPDILWCFCTFPLSHPSQLLLKIKKYAIKISEMSKGTKEKVQLALVMSRKAKIYILDEPENSLSAENQISLMKFMEDSVRFYNK